MDNIVMIEVSKIKPSNDNRQSEADIGILPSIQHVGIINPIQVVKANKKYQVVAGNRRLASAVHFGLAEVPCIIMGSKDTISIQAAENFDRKPLNPLDEADMIVKLRNDGVADSVIQDWLHIGQRDFNRRLLLLDLCDEAKADLKNGLLCLGSALELATIKDPTDQAEAYKKFGNDDKQNRSSAKYKVRCNVKRLGYLPPMFLEYSDSNGRSCNHCQYASGCSDDYSLFAEGEEKYCHDTRCFRTRLEEYRKERNVSAKEPPNCEREWNYVGHEEDFIQVIDDNGITSYYKEKPGKADNTTGSADKTLPCRKAHNKAMKTLNPILTEIAQLTVEKLKDRYASLYRDDLTDLPLERDLIDRMAAFTCSELHHEATIMMGKILGYEGEFDKRLRHVWCDKFEINEYRRQDKTEVTVDDLADSFAWAAVITRVGKFRFSETFLSKALSGSGAPQIIKKDNQLIDLARDAVPEWYGNDLYAKWCKAWEDYVSEQKSLGNSNVK